MKKTLLVTSLAFSCIACNAQNDGPKQTTSIPAYISNVKSVNNLNTNIGIALIQKNDSLDQLVNNYYDKLTNKERAAQMIMLASSEKLGFEYLTYVKPNIQKGNAANVLFLKGSKKEFISQANELNQFTTKGLKPIYACDCEPTLLHNKFTGEIKMSATGTLDSEEKVKASVDTINNLMDQIGIQINFAPIVDISTNASIINKRSFGSDGSKIIPRANDFINFTQNDHKAATIKHFPGHGAVVGDTHKESVYINGKMTELDNFKNIIGLSHPALVMVGHISIKNNPDGYNTEEGRPATTSRKIVTDLLKTKMGYKGIITTDAMNMAASKNFPNADWEAVKAGVDLILMPKNPKLLNELITEALEKNSPLSKEIEVSVKKIIKLKLLTGN